MSLCGLLAAAPLAAADVVATVTSSGTIAEYAPGASFVLTEPAGPVTYAYGPQVVYTTTSGAVIPATEVRSRIQVGTPVDVHYVMQGDRRIINRVIVREPAVKQVEVREVEVKDADDDDDD
jgi:hypothetical protein